MKRRYYSLRTGKNPNADSINLHTLKILFASLYRQWDSQGYFQEHFGYYCVDNEDVPGKLGTDLPSVFLFHLRKENIWPIQHQIETYSEDDLFDVIEFLHDHVSFPLEGYFHSYSGCGYHYQSFDSNTGQREYREKINELLEQYGNGFELSETGELLELPPPGTANLLAANIPTDDPNVKRRIDSAISKFRRHRSTAEERRDAIRDLADVLEYLRPKIKTVLTNADESDLFNLANNFGIRHHNQQQRTEYDHSIWLSWMFYFYLATIHACVRMLDRKMSKSSSKKRP